MSVPKVFGLIGYPLTHSFSKAYFSKKFESESIKDCFYENFPLNNVNDFALLIQNNPSICGLNVTIPYKETIIPFLDELDPVAATIQAVNTIQFKQGKLIGYNTDVIGFELALREFLPKQWSSEALILGTGGSSKAVKFVLDKLMIPASFVSSKTDTSHLTYTNLAGNLKRYPLIINTTPLGMSPNTNECPNLPWSELDDSFYLFDLIYNPPLTRFLTFGKSLNAHIKNGLQMLEEQAEAAWKIWNLN
jgi:shikimate dehydrogenase